MYSELVPDLFVGNIITMKYVFLSKSMWSLYACCLQKMAESADQIDVEYKKFSPRCIKHDSDLLPVFCRDCNRLICSDCVATADHVGHNLCKVSDVAEFHQNKLEDVILCRC